jgi:integrase
MDEGLFLPFARAALEETARDVSPGWGYIRRLHLERHLGPFFGSRTVREIGPRDVEGYKRARLSEGARASTVNRELATLSRVMRLAVGWGVIERSPLEAVARLPRGEERIPRALGPSEVSRLLEAARGHPFGLFVELALYTGGRPREVLNLRGYDLDRVNGLVRFEHRPDHPVKTRRSRVVPMCGALREALEARPRPLDERSPLFPGLDASQPRRAFLRPFRALAREAGLPKLTPYMLRHTCATMLARAGVSGPKIGAVLGHRCSTTTARYIHLEAGDLRGAVEALSIRGSEVIRPALRTR